MQTILSEIENYGFTTEKLGIEDVNGFICENPNTRVSFVLDNSVNNYMNFESLKNKYRTECTEDIPVVFLIPITENAEHLIGLIEAGHMEGEDILIWDSEDELEFFLKDLWDILFKMGTLA